MTERKRTERVARVTLPVLALLLVGAASPDDWAARLIEAQREGSSIPVLSSSEPELTLERGYAVQRAYVAARLADGGIVGGFKAGLTSSAAQQRFGVDAPLVGVLFEQGHLAPGDVVRLDGYRAPRVELEIGFLLGEPITEPVQGIEALKAKVVAVAPAVELPELGFARPESLTGADIAAANVAARRYIVGGVRLPEGLDLAGVEAELSRDGEIVHTGRGSDVMGDPWRVALWLVNRGVALGYEPERGHMLLTGALGGMTEAVPGGYQASFGELGEVTFELR